MNKGAEPAQPDRLTNGSRCQLWRRTAVRRYGYAVTIWRSATGTLHVTIVFEGAVKAVVATTSSAMSSSC